MEIKSDSETIEYRKYDARFEPEVLEIFTASFENYPLFYGIFKDGFKDEKKFLEFYKCLMRVIFRATIRQYGCYIGFKDDKIVSLVIIESPDDKPVGVWDYTVCGMMNVILKLGLKKTFGFMDLSDQTERVVRGITEPHWHLYFLSVDPEHQGEGIGSHAIKSFVIPLVKENGGKLITVTTNAPDNVNFYLNSGFSLVEEETLEYSGNPVGNWTFRMDL